MTQETQKTDLVIRRIFEASLAQVWQAWTDTEMLRQWWAPDGFECSVARLDVHEGGTSLIGMESPQMGAFYSTWRYEQIVPQQTLVFIHNLADSEGRAIDPASVGMPPDFPRDQRQTVTFRAIHDQQTEMIVTEHDWTPGQMMEMSRMGMEQCLAKLAILLA